MNPQLKQAKIIHFGMAMGVVILVSIILILFVLKRGLVSSAGPSALNPILFLSGIHVLVLIGTRVLSRLIMSTAEKNIGVGSSASPDQTFARWQTLQVIGLALREGPALIGLVTCLQAVLTGVMQSHPFLWLNLISSFLLIAYVIRTFPNEDRLSAALGMNPAIPTMIR